MSDETQIKRMNMGELETEVMDKLFLELSQFTKATTLKERILVDALKNLVVAVETKDADSLRELLAARRIIGDYDPEFNDD